VRHATVSIFAVPPDMIDPAFVVFVSQLSLLFVPRSSVTSRHQAERFVVGKRCRPVVVVLGAGQGEWLSVENYLVHFCLS